ncbi:hypothetical protein Cgig2_008691 [Carnegiea gigantea]|uniref:Uncharacterized protein n=1 Tax=Carnegiea gigantea TaxID=171969 RepID=A0A9Q1GUJ2_9CARY|nr:hypothetical protein Cgig2_008691 [Carnegiea gigantea]
MTPIRILPVIHFGGDKFLSIMDFRYEFVPNEDIAMTKESYNRMQAHHPVHPVNGLQSTDYFTDPGRGVTVEDDRRSRRSPKEQPREPTQTYRRIRKGKEPVQPHGYPTDAMYGYAGFQEVPSSFTGPGLFAPLGGYDTYGGVLNNYGHSSTNTNCPPPLYPSHEPQFVGSDSSRRHRDSPPIINQGTINYGDHHYHQPTFYSGNSTSCEQSWMDSTASSIFYPQQSYGVDQNNDNTYQDPPRHSFRW